MQVPDKTASSFKRRHNDSEMTTKHNTSFPVQPLYVPAQRPVDMSAFDQNQGLGRMQSQARSITQSQVLNGSQMNNEGSWSPLWARDNIERAIKEDAGIHNLTMALPGGGYWRSSNSAEASVDAIQCISISELPIEKLLGEYLSKHEKK
jgi:hypothetical protein